MEVAVSRLRSRLCRLWSLRWVVDAGLADAGQMLH